VKKRSFPVVTAEVVRRKSCPRFLFIFFVGVIVSYFSAPANAFPGGESGYSGRNGSTCTMCHSTGAAPAITWMGPTSINSGATANFTLTVGGGGNGGLDVASTAGTFTAGAGTKVLNGEITQSSATSTHSWTFSWTAPTVTSNTMVTMYGAAVDGSGGGTGTTTQTITVMAAAPPPPPPPPPPPQGSAIAVSPGSLAFSYSQGGTSPAAQGLSVSSTGAALTYTVSMSGGTWLTAKGGGTTPGSVSVGVNPAGLNAGTYNGSVVIASTTASNSSKTIPVTLTVTSTTPPPPPPPSGGTLTVSTSRLVFFADGSQTPSAKTISVHSTGSPITFTAAAYGSSWVSVTPSGGTTPGTVSVSAYATGLPAGTYSCVVQIKGGSSTKNVEIVLVVGTSQSSGEGDDEPTGAQVRPFTFDPGGLGTSRASWQNGAGALRSSYDPNNQGLVLTKRLSAPTTAIAGAIVKGGAGSRISTLGFDVRTDSECSRQAPQFVVITADNVVHTAGCTNGSSQMLSVPGWKRVTFNTGNRAQVTPAIQPGMTVKTVALVMDHVVGNGFAVLDNINLNGLYIGKQ
jgi:Viral BACON domain